MCSYGLPQSFYQYCLNWATATGLLRQNIRVGETEIPANATPCLSNSAAQRSHRQSSRRELQGSQPDARAAPGRVTNIWCNGKEYIAMTTRVSTSLRNLAFLSIAAAGLTFAQTASTSGLTGTFVFSERGNATATLASLTIAADGSASGTAVVQQGHQVYTYAVQG